MTFSGIVNVPQRGRSFKDARVSNAIFKGESIDNLLDMRKTDFSGADMVNVRFNLCDLRGVNFDGAKFENVSFYACIFYEKYIPGRCGTVEIVPFYRNGIRVDYNESRINGDSYYMFNSDEMYYPIETDGEELYGYKKVLTRNCGPHYAIAKLRIPAYAERIVYKDNKCRASCAQVVDIYDEYGVRYYTGTSIYYRTTKCKYNLGHMVYADDFNDNPFEICSNGIHFFLTEQEAWDYTG